MLTKEDIDKIPTSEIAANIGPLTDQMTPEVWGHTLVRIWTCGPEVDAKHALVNLFEYLWARGEDNKAAGGSGEITFMGDSTTDEVTKWTNWAAARIMEDWKAKEKQHKQDKCTMSKEDYKAKYTDEYCDSHGMNRRMYLEA